MADLDQTSAAAIAAAGDLEGLSETPKSFGRLAWERFIHHRLALIGAGGLLIIVAAFVIGPMISDFAFDERNVRDRLQGPNSTHWFGTDEIGRDLFVRTARGGQYSLGIGALAATIATAFGTLIGAAAAYFGRSFDVLVSQLINLLLVVPGIIILSVFALKFGSTWWKLALVIAALTWTRIARVVRGVVLSLKEQEFVMAARAAGASHARIIFRHILPNVVGVVAVEITLLLGSTIVLESTLSFLGLGVKPPQTSLGLLVADAKGNIDNDPFRVLTPGIFIVLIVLCVNFLGDGLRDALDPRSKVDNADASDDKDSAVLDAEPVT
jgi:ABC-type dipeptide/oligopeptide/nickel transport system permease subunit